MKTNLIFRAFASSFIIGSMLMFSSCEKDDLTEKVSPKSTNDNSTENVTTQDINTVCGSTTYTLWAGQTIDAGTLTVSNDATNLYVNYTTTGTFGTLHLWVGTDWTLLPVNPQGTPVPGQFPYHFDATGLNTYTFTIPLSGIPYYSKCGDVIYVVAHAEVGSETAFGGNIPGTGTPRWYYYAAYKTFCCEEPPPPQYGSRLGTAFAKGGYVFTINPKSNPERLPSLMLTNNRWGWAINLKSVGSTNHDLWVGAGLNYTSKGKLVGSVNVNYTGSNVTVTYNLSRGFAIEEGHIYAGDFKPVTLAPGRYGNTFYFNPFVSNFATTIDVSDSNGDGVWLIVHAVAYGLGVTNP